MKVRAYIYDGYGKRISEQIIDERESVKEQAWMAGAVGIWMFRFDGDQVRNLGSYVYRVRNDRFAKVSYDRMHAEFSANRAARDQKGS